MLIDWFTVFAQIVNFLILAYLLKRFLFKPVLNAIEEREQRIANQLQDAAAQKAEAVKERDQYEQLNRNLDQEKESLLVKARDDAEKEQKRLLLAAKQEYADLRNKLQEALNSEQHNWQSELRQHTQREVFNIARKVLKDLAETGLETQIITVFIHKLTSLSAAEKDKFRQAYKSDPASVLVFTAFDLPAELRSTLGKTIEDMLGPGVNIQYRTDPGETGGIALRTGGYKLSWTINEYLDGLEKRIDAISTETINIPPESSTTTHGN